MMVRNIFTVKKAIPIILVIFILIVFLILIFRGFKTKPKIPPVIPQFLKIETDYYVYDEVAGHLHKPQAKREYTWPEHKKGKIVMQTNNLGFREDVDTKKEKPAGITRILITGDSHIDGVVYNSESFPNQLEYLLNRGEKNPRYECINGGVGSYGPQNYSGFLKRFLYLKPDVFVVVLYTGNDFLDTFYIEENSGRLKTPLRTPGYHDKLLEADKVLSGSVAQSLNQIFFFKTYPGLMGKAVEITAAHIEIINQICQDNKIKLLIVLLPTKLDIESDTDRERIMAASEILQLSGKDFGITRQLTGLLISRLTEKRINYIDLFAPMKKKLRQLYWKKDHHLSSRGHRVIARIIYNSPYRSLFTGNLER